MPSPTQCPHTLRNPLTSLVITTNEVNQGFRGVCGRVGFAGHLEGARTAGLGSGKAEHIGGRRTVKHPSRLRPQPRRIALPERLDRHTALRPQKLFNASTFTKHSVLIKQSRISHCFSMLSALL